RSINITPEMRAQLAQIAAKSEGNVTEADLIRDAIRQYLDQQSDLVGSRRHFQKSLQAQFERLECTLTLHLHVMIALISMLLADETGQSIIDAIVIARRDGKRLLARIEAVRDLKVQP